MVSTVVSSESSAGLVLSQRDVMVVILCLVVVALFVVLQPFILSFTYHKQLNRTKNNSPDPAHSFFETPYITWFLVHNGIAALAMIVILILGLDAVIDKTTCAALLGSLFGYVLGSSANNSKSKDLGNKPVDTPNANSEPPAGELSTFRFTEDNLIRLKEIAEEPRS